MCVNKQEVPVVDLNPKKMPFYRKNQITFEIIEFPNVFLRKKLVNCYLLKFYNIWQNFKELQYIK